MFGRLARSWTEKVGVFFDLTFEVLAVSND